MQSGTLTVLSGPMFAGKTDTLITMASAIVESGRRVYYPEIDTRYEPGHVTAHNGRKIVAEPIDAHLNRVEEAEHIFIDEAQFLSTIFTLDKIMDLVRKGLHVTLAGLDLDYKERPFGLMPEFMVRANKVLKIHGICAVCGQPSNRTYRKTKGKAVVQIGGPESYEPRCLSCYTAG